MSRKIHIPHHSFLTNSITTLFISIILSLLFIGFAQANELSSKQQVEQVMEELAKEYPDIEYTIEEEKTKSPVVVARAGYEIGKRLITILLRHRAKKEAVKHVIKCQVKDKECLKREVNAAFDKLRNINTVSAGVDFLQYFLENHEKNKFKFTLTPDKSSYSIGDVLSLSVKTSKACFLTLIDFSTTGQVSTIFPNAQQSNNFIAANKTKELRFRVTDVAGKERILGICRTDNVPVEWEQQAEQYKTKGVTFIEQAQEDMTFDEAAVSTTFQIKN